jgi:hypothetical protein
LQKIAGAQCTIFDLPTLQEATENFSEKNKLGEGGFGIVYKVSSQAETRVRKGGHVSRLLLKGIYCRVNYQMGKK